MWARLREAVSRWWWIQRCKAYDAEWRRGERETLRKHWREHGRRRSDRT